MDKNNAEKINEELLTFLKSKLQEFRSTESRGFEFDLLKGKILYEAQVGLNDMKNAEDYWTHWVRNDVGIALRTAQRYRTVYASFIGDRLAEIPEYPTSYLQSVGSTRLDLIITINNHLRNCKELENVIEIEFCDDGIYLQQLNKDREVRIPISEVAVKDLRNLKPKNEKVSPSNDEDMEAEITDLRRITNPKELRKLVQSERKRREKAENKVGKLKSKVLELEKERDHLRKKLKQYEGAPSTEADTTQAEDASTDDTDSSQPDMKPAA